MVGIGELIFWSTLRSSYELRSEVKSMRPSPKLWRVRTLSRDVRVFYLVQSENALCVTPSKRLNSRWRIKGPVPVKSLEHHICPTLNFKKQPKLFGSCHFFERERKSAFLCMRSKAIWTGWRKAYCTWDWCYFSTSLHIFLQLYCIQHAVMNA